MQKSKHPKVKKPKLLLALSELFTLVPKQQDEYRHLEFAQIAEQTGFDGVFVSEHVVMGPSACANGLAENPRAFVLPHMQDPSTPWPSPLIKLAALAGATKSIRILSLAVLAPLRHPIHLAKELATLDLISQGRLTLLPTVSWHEEEYRALGVPFNERGKRLDEHLEIWHKLWRETPVSHHGQFYQFDDVYFEPKPYNDVPKIWFGGGELNQKVIDRIVNYGSGMMPGFFPSKEDFGPLATAMSDAGRSFDELELTTWLVPDLSDPEAVGDFDKTLDEQIENMVNVGYSHIGIKPSCFIDNVNDMANFCEHVVKRVDQYFEG